MQLAFPDAAWARSFGLAIIFVGLLAFLLEVEIDNTRVTVGHGQRNWREHLNNGLTRLRTYWPSLALIVVAIIVIAMALERSWFGQRDPPAEAPATAAKADAPPTRAPEATPLERGDRPPVTGLSEVPSRRDAAPKIVYVPAPERPRAQPEKVAAEPGPEVATPPEPSVQAIPPASPDPESKKELSRGPTPEEVAAARKHRDEGDALFKRLFDAKGAAKVNAIAQEVDVWDRRGADLVVDALGSPYRSSYLNARVRYEFYPPLSISLGAQLSPSESQAFFNRRDMLNMIRNRQHALSTLFAAERPK